MKKQLPFGQLLPLLVLFQLVPLLNYAADFFPDPNVADGAPNSLRAAITLANSNNEADVIHLSAGIYGITLAGINENVNATGDFDVLFDDGNRLTIVGLSPALSIIDGNNIDRVIHTYGNASLTLENLTVQNGLADEAGGIRAVQAGNLRIENCHIINNKLTGIGFGGGIFFTSLAGTLQVYNSLFENNSAGNGSGLSFYFSSTSGSELVNVIFRNNTAEFQGAVNINVGGVIKMINCLVVDNQSVQTWPGGVVVGFDGADLTVINSTIADNTGLDPEFGQGIAAFGGKLTLQNTLFSNPGLNASITNGEPELDGNGMPTGALLPVTDFTSNGGNISDDNSAMSFLTGPNDLNDTEIGFSDPADSDYTLAAGSPAINNGIFSAEVPDEDLQGRDRIIDGIIDSGAYEFRAFEELPLFSRNGILLLGFLMLSISALVLYKRML